MLGNRLIVIAVWLSFAVTGPRVWAINCDVVFPPTTFQTLLDISDVSTMQAWLVSPSEATNVTPSGSTPCNSPSYFGQFDVNGSSNLCVNGGSSLTPTATGCAWNLYQSNGFVAYVFNFNINCDPNAGAPIVPPPSITSVFSFIGRFGEETYSANFTSNVVCGDAPLFRIAKKP